VAYAMQVSKVLTRPEPPRVRAPVAVFVLATLPARQPHGDHGR
jgi:hypothetical protein